MSRVEQLCISALAPELARRGIATQIVDLADTDQRECDPSASRLKQLLAAPNAVVILGARETFQALVGLRPRQGLFVVYMSHGIAPFKRVSYAPHVQDYDLYLASTDLIKDRLCRLYPQNSHLFVTAGYPRLDEIADQMRQRRKLVEIIAALYFGARTSSPEHGQRPRTLVVFSWGITPDAISLLPDITGVVYLFHPAIEDSLLSSRQFTCALALRSTPILVADLLTAAEIVVGDLSSLTFEAIALGRKVHLLLDLSLYPVSYDLDQAFLDPGSVFYLRAPMTGFAIDPRFVMSFAELLAILASGQPAIGFGARAALDRAALPAAWFPPFGVDSRPVCADEIIAAALQFQLPVTPSSPAIRHNLSALVGLCYQLVLNRDPDPPGLCNCHARYGGMPLQDSADAAHLTTLLVAELMASDEARQLRGQPHGQSALLRHLQRAGGAA